MSHGHGSQRLLERAHDLTTFLCAPITLLPHSQFPQTYCSYGELNGRDMITGLSDVPKPTLQCAEGERDSAHRPRGRSILGRVCARPESSSSHGTRQPRAYAGGLGVQRRGERIAQVSLRPGDRPPTPRASPAADATRASQPGRTSRILHLRYSPRPPRGSGPLGPARRTRPFRVCSGTLFRPTFPTPPGRK